jgi:hypothetical protein
MAATVEQAARIDPDQCRRTAAERFAPDRVAVAYEAVYREALAGQVRAAHTDRTRVPDV